MGWRRIIEELPARGQRCLVWDEVYSDVAIAYWDADARIFYRAELSHFTPIDSATFWQPEPQSPYRQPGHTPLDRLPAAE